MIPQRSTAVRLAGVAKADASSPSTAAGVFAAHGSREHLAGSLEALMSWSLAALIALGVALALTLVFVSALGWRRPGEQSTRTGWGEAATFFFAVVFLATWVGGALLHPVGLARWPWLWLPSLIVGVVVALILAAAISTRRRRWGTGPAGPVAVAMDDAGSSASGLTAFVWVLVFALALVLALLAIA